MIMRRYAVAACLILLVAAPDNLAHELDVIRFEFSQAHMGTRFRVVLYAPDAGTAERASKAAFDRVAHLDDSMSDYRETSELMSLCRRAGGPAVKVSDDLFRVLAASQQLAARSGGAFDVTTGPVVRLWRRARRTQVMPDPARLAEAQALTGYTKMHLDARARTVRLERPGMLLDLGGIAKGFAADEALAVLRKYGVTRALVAAGGDIVAGDAPPGIEGWTVAVLPLDARVKSSSQNLLLKNCAVSTSGDVEQHVEIGGVRYSHIIDPRTGLGLRGQSSVTVVAPDGTTSDAAATAVSVLGPARGVKLIDTTNGAAAFIVQAAGDGTRVFTSRRWKDIKKAEARAEAKASLTQH